MFAIKQQQDRKAKYKGLGLGLNLNIHPLNSLCLFSLQKSLHHFSSLYKEQSLELSALVVESYSFILMLLDSLLTGILNVVSRLNIELHFILPPPAH